MIYLQIEPEFSHYTWCELILRSLYDEVKRKRIDMQEITSPEQIERPGSCVLLLGATREWISTLAKQVHNKNCHPIALDSRRPRADDQNMSTVMMDIHSSTQLALDYLHSLGRSRIAMYGINPNSASDMWRAEVFHLLTGSEEHIFFNDVSVADTFQKFIRVLEEYDSVLCANDYVAVSLLKRLQQQNYPVPEKLYIISYGNMNLCRLTQPGITSISNDHEHFGKAALSICSMIERNRSISTINIQLHSRLHIRGTTEFQPYDPDTKSSGQDQGGENRFYSDPEVAKLAKLETMFSQCDETDYALIRSVMDSLPYSAMAQQCYISETAAKYRVRKLEKLCGVSSRQELRTILKDFF